MNSISIRNEASRQYFELRNELNRANRTKNQKTELEFELREDAEEHFVIIKSTLAEHGLRIAYKRKSTMDRWILFENENYRDFFKYMFLKISKLNYYEEININTTLTSWLLGLWVS